MGMTELAPPLLKRRGHLGRARSTIVRKAFGAKTSKLTIPMKVTVLGRFSDLAGTLTLDEREPTNSHVTVTIGTASLDTQLAARDKHLHAADFFDVEHYPAMTFTSRRIEEIGRAHV